MPALLATLALTAISAQSGWQRVEGPATAPIESFAVAPAGAGGLFASVRTFAYYAIHSGAQVAWSRRGASWTSRWSSSNPHLIDIEPDLSRPGALWGANYTSVLRSLDGGLSWTAVWTADNPVEALAVDPNDPDRVYAVGTPYAPSGQFHRTLDGGRSWTSVAHWNMVPLDVAVSPRAVLVAGNGGVSRSVDRGDTFTIVLVAPAASRIAVSAGNPSFVWCLTGNSSIAQEVHRSVDGGQHFAPTTSPGVDLSAIAAHPTDPDVACVVTVASGVFATFDGGQTWSRSTGIPDTAYLRTIRVDPAEPSHLFGGGVGSQGGVWFSADFGLRWRPCDRGLHVSLAKLVFDSGGRACAAGPCAPLRRSGGGRWEVLDHPQGSTGFVSDLAVDPTRPETIAWINVVPTWSLTNQVWLSSDDGRTWQNRTPPAAQHPEFDVRVVRFDREGTLYAASQNGAFFRLAAGSPAWSNHEGPWGGPRNFVPDPSDASVIHVTDSVDYHHTTDGGRHWTTGAAGLSGIVNFDALSVSSFDPDELFVLANDSPTTRRLFRSLDRGASFAPAGSGHPAEYLACLALDPSVDGRMLVGTREGSVLMSSDRGASFVPFQDGIDGAPVLSIAFDPTRPGVALLSQAGGGLFERALP